jgi:Secretion system C-terminal sorting domain/PA domain
MTKKTPILLFAVLVLLPLAAAFGQTTGASPRADTVLLSVYNTGNKYRLTPATFSAATSRTTWVTDMVWVTDTIVRFTDGGSNATLPAALLAKMPDSLRRVFTSQRTMNMLVTQQCDKPMRRTEIEGKVVILALSQCDASQKALLAQRAGAKAIVFVHSSNDPNGIEIKTGAFKDSITIPCYTVRQDIGKRISGMLPSKVAVVRPDTMPLNAEALRTTNNGSTPTQSQQGKNGAEETDPTLNKVVENQSNPIYANNLNNSPFKLTDGTGYNWRISPNPTTDYTTVEYRFSRPTDVTIEIFTATGQTMSRYTYKAASSGSVEIPVENWASGTYTVHLTPKGNTPSVKKVVVQH